MATACNFKAPNGRTSELYKNLETKLGTDMATQTWNYVYSTEFANKYGQWHAAIKNILKDFPDTDTDDFRESAGFMLPFAMNDGHENIGIDSNGEPTAEWVIDKLNVKPVTNPVVKDPTSQNLQEEITSKLKDFINESALKHLEKEKVKTRVATQYIGEGSKGSSTDNYRRLYSEYNLANTGNYKADDIVWVSSNGKRSGRINPVINGELQGEYINVDKAIKAGATIIMDTEKHIANTAAYNIGEVALLHYMESHGYYRVGESGVWRPKSAPTNTTVPIEKTNVAVLKVGPELFGLNKKANRITFEEARTRIENLFDKAANNPQTDFDLTYFNPKKARKTSETGFSPVEMAAMFSMYPIPANVKFNEDFKSLMENTPGAQRRRLSFSEVHFLNFDEGRVQNQRGKLVVEVKDKNGNLTGQYFSSSEQIQAINTIVSIVQENFIKEDGPTDTEDKDTEAKNKVERILGPSGMVMTKLKNQLNKAVLVYQGKTQNSGMTKEEAAARIVNLTKVINSFGDLSDATGYGLVNKALYKLNQLGIKVKVVTKASTTELLDGDDGEFGAQITEDSGRGLVDWSESSFNLDPKDTASARIKLFIASIQKVDVGPEREPRRVRLSYADKDVRKRILGLDEELGRKTISIIPNELAQSLKLTPGSTALTQVEADGTTKLIKVTALRTVTADDILNPKIQANAEEEGVALSANNTVLQLEEWTPKQNVIRPRQNFIGFAEIVDFESLFQDLLETTLGHDNTIEGVIKMLEDAGKEYKPVYSAVASRLKSQPLHIQREFVTVMSKQFAQYQISLLTKRRSGFLDVTPINANRGSMLNNIINTWKENQKNAPILKEDVSGNLVINKELAKELKDRLDSINETYSKNEYPDKKTVLLPLVHDLFATNGIVLNDKALNYLLDNIAKLTENTQLAGGLQKQFSVTEDGKPSGIFSTIIYKLNGVGDDENFTERETSYLLNNNPLYTEQTTMQILARVAMRFSERTASGSHKSSQGKNVYDFVLNDHLSLRVAKIKKDTSHLITLKSTLLGAHNWLVNSLLNDKKRADFGMMYMDGMKESYKEGGGIDRPSMSPREQLVDSLARFQNQGNKKVNFVALTLSDKTKSPIFTGITKIDVGNNGQSPEIQNEIFNVFQGEFDRIKQWSSYKDTATIDAYKKGGGYFYAIPEMNWDSMNALVKDGTITDDELKQIWLEKGKPNLNGSTPLIKDLVMKIFYSKWLQEEGQALYGKLYTEGIVEQGLLDYSYMIKNLWRVGINKVGNSFVNASTGQEVDENETKRIFLNWAVKDYLLNYFIFNRSMSVMFSGDPAFTFKGKDGQSEAQQIEATMKEYQKRLAGLVAPGEDPTWDGGREERYTTVVLQDDERITNYVTAPGWDGKTNGTDAQELTTVREHLYVMKAKGLLDQELFDEMVTIIDNGLKNDNGYYEFTDPKHTAVVMQIMKPVYYSDDFSTIPGNMVMHYVKTSAMPLYPPMTRMFQIDDIRMKMEGQFNPETGNLENYVSRASFISGKKVGAPTGKGAKVFNDNGDVKINDTDWNKSKQVVKRDGFRIQQTVPYDELKAHILTISQLNKLLTESTEHIQDFKVRNIEGTFDSQGVTGAQLLRMKEDLRKQMVQLQYEDLLDKLGAEVSNVTGQPVIKDYNKIFDILREEAISRSYPANDLAYLEARIREVQGDGSQEVALEIPLYFNASADRFEQLLLSLVKQVAKVYLPGKSYIQASSAGFKFKDKTTFENLTLEEKKGIVWIGDHNGQELKTITKVPGAEALKGAQVLVPFNFIIRDRSGKEVRADVKDFLVERDGRYYLDEAKVPKELTQMIGARIPNQGHNSMLPIEVAGFVPANMGDVIVVPAAITTQMGADFDVDKLYTYRRSYGYDSRSKSFYVDDFQPDAEKTRLGADDAEWQSLKQATYEKLKAQNHEAEENGYYPKEVFNKALGEVVQERYPNPDDVPTHVVPNLTPTKPTVDQLANQYFDLHWAVLTHPAMYDKILRPLDKEDLKDQAKRFGNVNLGHYYSVLRQMNDFMSQKDAKIMVGISSLFVTFNSIVQNKNLFVGKNPDMIDTPFLEDEPEPQALVQLNPEENEAPARETNGIRFQEEGYDEVHEAYKISGISKAAYYENDVEERVDEDGQAKKVFVDPVTDKVVGDFDPKQVFERTKHDNHTTIQSEVLDHAKNRTIDNLNLNLSTVYAWFAANQLSSDGNKGVSLKMTTLLMKQPAIIEYVNRVSRSQDTFAEGFDPDVSKKTVEELISREITSALGKATNQEQSELLAYLQADPQALLKYIKANNYDVMSVPRLKEGLKGEDNSAAYHLRQVGALLNFYKLDTIGKELGKFQKLLNQDTAGPGHSMVQVFDTIANRSQLEESELIANAEDLINDTEQGFIHHTLLGAVESLFTKLLPFHGFADLLESIRTISRREKLSVNTQRDIISAYKSFVYSGANLGLSESATVDRFRLLYGTDKERSLAHRVWEAKQSWGKDNYFMNRLQPQQGETSVSPSYVFYQASKTSDLDDQENTGAFLEMLTSTNPEIRQLGHDLVRYAFLVGGLPGAVSFIRYIPEGFLRSLPFAKELREENKQLQQAKLRTGSFIRQLVQHNPSLAPKLRDGFAALENGGDYNEAPEEFSLLPVNATTLNNLAGLVIKNEDGYEYPHYISYYNTNESMYYLYENKDGGRHYKRIDTLGSSYSSEYNKDATKVRSIFTENRAFINDEKETGLVYVDPKYGQADVSALPPSAPKISTRATVDLGLKQPTYTKGEVTKLLQDVSKNPKVSKSIQIVAAELAKVVKKTQVDHPLTISVLPSSTDGIPAAGRAWNTGQIELYTEGMHPTSAIDAGGILVHEVFHGISAPFSASPTLRKKYSKINKVYNELETLRAEARQRAIEALTAAGFTVEQAENSIKSRTPSEDGDLRRLARVLYSTSSTEEFMANILENEETQRFLNEEQRRSKKTMWQEVISLLTKFLTALAEELGVKINENSLLEQGLMNTFKYLNKVKEADFISGRGEKDVINAIEVTYFKGKPFNTVEFQTEQEAKEMLQTINKNFPQVTATLDDNPFYWGINLKAKDGYSSPAVAFETAKETKDPIDKILGKLNEQIQELRSGTGRQNKDIDVLVRQQLIADARASMSELTASRDLNTIKKVARAQIDWADAIADRILKDNKTATTSEIMTAMNLLGTWSTLVDSIYGESPDRDGRDQEFYELENKANDLLREYTRSILKPAHKAIIEERLGLDLQERDYNSILDVDTPSAKLLSVERAKSRVIQAIGTVIQNTNRAYLEDGEKVVRRIQSFEKELTEYAKSKGIKKQSLYDMFFQENESNTAWGLVGPISGSFYGWHAGLKKTLMTALDTANGAPTTIVRDSMIRQAWNNYWHKLQQNAQVIDIRKLVDETTGKPVDNPISRVYRQELEKEYGKEQTDEFISQAQNRFNKYLEDKEEIKTAYEGQVTGGLMTQEQMDEKMLLWDEKNSPYFKLRSKEGVLMSMQNFNLHERYLMVVPKKNATNKKKQSYFDDKYSHIKSDPQLMELYNKLKDFMKEFTDNLPWYLEGKLHDNFLPVIKKSLVTDITQVPEYVKQMPEKFIDSLTADSYEEFMQSRSKKEIPIMYLEGDTKNAADVAKRTRDIPRMLELFGLMSYHYLHFSEAKDAIDMGEAILKKTDEDLRNGSTQIERNGKVVTVKTGLPNILGSLEYTRDALMYKTTKNLEAKLGNFSRKLATGKVEKVKDIRAKLYDLKQEHADNLITDDEYDKRAEVLKKELEKWEARSFYASKVGDALIKWTQRNALSYNPLSAINNFVFGIISSSIHANGKGDFDWKQWRKAFSIMMNATGRSVGMARLTGNDNAMHATAEKILNIMDRMGIMGELTDSEYGRSNVERKRSGWRQTLSPYQMMRTGDYFVKGLNTVAVLLSKKVTVNGKEMSAWEAIDRNGHWLDKADTKWESEDPKEHVEWNKLRNQAISVNKIIMGNQDKSSPVWAKKNVLWRLLGQFRMSWLSEGFASRFEGEWEDINLGRKRKGRYRTYADLGAIGSIKVLLRQIMSIVADVDPYTGTRKSNGEPLQEMDKENMRRNLSEIGWFLLLFGAVAMINAASSGDDEAKKKKWKFLANMLTRSYQDVSLYASPSIFDSVLGTSIPAITTIKNAEKAIMATWKLMYDDDYTWEEWMLKQTKAGWIPETTLINKFKTMTERDISTLSR